jgi:hypothetical protein
MLQNQSVCVKQNQYYPPPYDIGNWSKEPPAPLLPLVPWSIHGWGTKKECLSFKGLESTPFDFVLFFIIVIVLDCFMPIGKMVSS